MSSLSLSCIYISLTCFYLVFNCYLNCILLVFNVSLFSFSIVYNYISHPIFSLVQLILKLKFELQRQLKTLNFKLSTFNFKLHTSSVKLQLQPLFLSLTAFTLFGFSELAFPVSVSLCVFLCFLSFRVWPPVQQHRS